MHIICESVLMLFTQNYQNRSMLDELQLAKVGEFCETLQCIVSQRVNNYILKLISHHGSPIIVFLLHRKLLRNSGGTALNEGVECRCGYTPCLKKTVHFCFCQKFVKFP